MSQAAPSLGIAALCLVLAACSSLEQVGGEPGAVALRVFELAREDEPATEDLERIFDPELLDRQGVALLDTLSALADLPRPELLDAQHPAGADQAYVDLATDLPGGGSASFSFKLRRSEDGRWQVTWLQGPGVEWPPARSRKGESLSTSSPPGLSGATTRPGKVLVESGT